MSISHFPVLLLTLVFMTESLNAQQFKNPDYSGYRLQLNNFNVLKEDDNSIKLSLDVANTGRYDVDLRREDIHHWIQVLFDPSFNNSKLFNLKGNIRDALFENGLSLNAGLLKYGLVLGVSTVKNPPLRPSENSDTLPKESLSEYPSDSDDSVTEKGGDSSQLPEIDLSNVKEEPCPDIAFLHLYLKKEDDKWAKVEYQIQNVGEGNYIISDTADKLIIRAFISGVPKLTRGALPIGGFTFEQNEGHPRLLKPGEKLTGEFQLDIRKKTRYMKCLILQLDSNQYTQECDRTNNTSSVILR